MSQANPKVSIIMPVYNVDRFVGRAIKSLQNQSCREIEIIVVDDGSTDRSGDIAERLAERDIRIEVIHTENAGAPAARNLALERARGRYIQFMDADDWVEPTMVADMVEAMERDDLELVITGFYIETYYSDDGAEHYSEVKSRPSRTYPTQEEFRAGAYELFDENLLYTPWNKLYLRERIEKLGLRFRDTFMDDFPFVLDYIRDVERVGVIEKPYYHFIRQRAESETSKWRPNLYEKREEEHEWMLELYRHWGLEGDEASQEMIQRRYIERLVGCIESVCSRECTLSRHEKRELVLKMISSDNAREAVRLAKPRSRMMAAVLAPIRAGNVSATMAEGKIISFVKHHSTRIFSRLRANR